MGSLFDFASRFTSAALEGSLDIEPLDPKHSDIISRTSSPGLDVFWQDDIPLRERGRQRWYYNRTRRPEQVTTLGVHHTGVSGGFGVRPYQYNPYLRVWDKLEQTGKVWAGDPPEERRGRPQIWISPELGRDKSRLAWAKLMALRERYASQPYHSISNVTAGELVVNHRLSAWTWHGNAMNRYTWGHAIDDVWRSGEDATKAMVDDEVNRLGRVISHCRKQGAPLDYIECHRQHTAKPEDPPDFYVKHVLDRVATLHGLTIRGNVKSGKGKPLWV